MQNSSGASTQRCLVPLAISKSPDTSPSSMTCPCMPLWKDCMILINFSGQPIFLSTCQSPNLFTESKALVRSMKTMYRSRFCSLHFSCICLAAKIMSVVPRPARKPHWLSGMMLLMPTWSLRRLSSTRARIFPALESREMPRWLSQQERSPLRL